MEAPDFYLLVPGHFCRNKVPFMNNKKVVKQTPIQFLLLGGYGEVGKTLARLLLKETSVNIIIAGRNKEKADELAATLNQEHNSNRVTSRYADATKEESLLSAFNGVSLVIVLTTTPDLIKQIGKAALISGCDYLDILVSETTIHDLSEIALDIKKANRTFITQAGFHPGLPAVFARSGAQYFDTYNKAIIAMAMSAKFKRADQAKEIIDLISGFSAEIYKNCSWQNATYKDSIKIDLGSPFGKKTLFPLQMEEMKMVQTKFNLKETGVYVAGFNWLVDWFIIPIIFIIQKIKKGFLTGFLCKLFTWGVNNFSGEQKGVVFLNQAEGIKDGKKLEVRIIAKHEDAYLFTAIPVVACLKQYLNKKISPGLWMMGHAVDEKILMDDLKQMGVKIKIEFAKTT